MSSIDHLVYSTSDLRTGMDEIERLLGVRPVLGGHHPDFGTHNALISLGPTTYLEVIAPNPNLGIPDRGYPFGIEIGQDSRLATWALRSENIEDMVTMADNSGLRLGEIEAGSRERQDGNLLSWRLTNPNAMSLGGTIPFLISWGKTPHPAANLPGGGVLESLCFEHPQPERIRKALKILDLDFKVSIAEATRIVATIMTPNGEVQLF